MAGEDTGLTIHRGQLPSHSGKASNQGLASAVGEADHVSVRSCIITGNSSENSKWQCLSVLLDTLSKIY